MVSIPVDRKIRWFRTLKPGWNYGEGAAFDATVLQYAVACYQRLKQLDITSMDAFPNIDGSVSIHIYDDSPFYYVFRIFGEDNISIITHDTTSGDDITDKKFTSLEESLAFVRSIVMP